MELNFFSGVCEIICLIINGKNRVETNVNGSRGISFLLQKSLGSGISQVLITIALQSSKKVCQVFYRNGADDLQ